MEAPGLPCHSIAQLEVQPKQDGEQRRLCLQDHPDLELPKAAQLPPLLLVPRAGDSVRLQVHPGRPNSSDRPLYLTKARALQGTDPHLLANQLNQTAKKGNAQKESVIYAGR